MYLSLSVRSLVRALVPSGLFATLLVLSAVVSLALPAKPRLPAQIDEQRLTTLKGNVHPLARPQNDRGVVPGTLSMQRMVLVLKRDDAQEKSLRAAIQQLHDPTSPNFHKWLTPQEFGSLYGPADADIAMVIGWLRGHGFQVAGAGQGKGTIEFSGTADQVSSAFHTSIHNYEVKGQKHFANATDPQIPTALTPVVSGILSLNNFVKQANGVILRKMAIATATSGEKTLKPFVTFGDGSHGVGPGDLWTIYNATPLITAKTNPIDGTGQTIAIVGRSDVTVDDIQGFRTNILPAPYSGTLPFTQINNGPDPGIVSGDNLEQSLDVEYSSAMAPAAQIDLVVSGSTATTDGVDLSALYIVDNNLAPVMSTSYGLCEAGLGTTGNQFYSQLWEQAAAQGITSMVSSGDNGAAGCDLVGPSGNDSIGYVADEGLQVSGLASTPFNVAVGGNEFTNDTSAYWSSSNGSSPAPLTSALSYVPETVWNESCSPLVCGNAGADIAAGSGGKSGCFTPTLDSNGNITACTGGYPEPDWQAGVSGLPSDGARHLPDVSLTAAGHDGYIVCFQGSCDSQSVYIVGGTSASSPAFAGIMSLVNQKTGSRQGQANYTLYRLAASEFGSAASPNTANLAACDATLGNAIGSQCIFHDVTTGTNAVPCDGGMLNCSSTTKGVYGVLTGWAAGAGYDNATGLGSVNVANLVNHWNDVTLTPTSTSLTVGATASTFGSPVAVSVAVTPTSGGGTPTGQVALLTDSSSVSAAGAGTVTLTNGAFSGNISSLPGGSYNLSARYAGDTTFGSSTSTGSKITVSPAASSTSLAFAAYDAVTNAQFTSAKAPYGSIIVATSTTSGVSGQIAPSGTVLFTSGGTTLATETSDPTGVATYTSNGYSLGTYNWKASYGGDGNYKASASPVTSFTVGQASTTLSLLTNTSYVVGTGSSTLTAIVNTDSFLLNPTGLVTFSVNGKNVGTASVSNFTSPSSGSSEAEATFVVNASLLAAGANTVTATYAGDTDYSGATSPSISIGYSATAPVNAITLAVSSTAVTLAQPVTLTATVVNGAIPATAGTVTFTDNGAPLATAQVIGSLPATGFTTGTAVLKTILAPGSHTLTATYAGILAAPTPVTSSTATVAVTGKEATTSLLSAVSDATNPSNYDLTATVTGFGLAVPSQSVDFAETSVISDLGTANLDPASAAHTFLSPMFNSASDPNGASPAQSVVADFNGDGIPDIATANASFSQSSMTVLIGNGDGTYKTPVLYPAGIFADAITTGDFNGDGILDIAVTNQYVSLTANNGFVSIFLGKGDGTFQPQIAANMPGFPINTIVADFNRDGILDIASLQYYPMQFSVEFGNGDGTFGPPTNYPVGYNDFSAYWMAAGDFNGDGAIDLVEVNAQDKSAEVFLNAGDGTFTLKENLTTGGGPQWVSVADLNSDGKADVIVSNYGDNTVGIFLGNGDGTFQDQAAYPVKGYGNSVAVGDLNGDGKLDLAVAYYVDAVFTDPPSIGILLGKGDGTFGKVKDVVTGQTHGAGVTIADLNGDGAPDLVSADIGGSDTQSQDISILLNVTQAKAKLSNATVAGAAGAQQYIQTTYSGDANYNASASAGVLVKSFGAKATPVILWSPATPWRVGVALGANVLNAFTQGNIAGSFAYTAQLGTGAAIPVTPTSSLSTPGSYTLIATFTPTDSVNYATATATQIVVIQAKVTPVILWSPASPWGVGVALGSNVLNAITQGNVAGSFAYAAQLGTSSAPVTAISSLSTPGSYLITATFTPTDTVNYTAATATQTVAIVTPDFNVQTSVNTLTIQDGQSGTLTVTIPPLYGFSGQVSLAGGSQLPGGFTITASPATVSAGGTSTVTIATTGLSSQSASLRRNPTSNPTPNPLAAGGIALSCLLAMPLLFRRTRALYGRQLMLLIGLVSLASLAACGGASYSPNSTLTLATSSPTAASGSGVTLTATVGGKHSNLGGMVTFYNRTTMIGAPVQVSGTTATLSVTSLPVGLDSITATYSGDQHNASASAGPLQQLITGQTTVEIVATSGTTTHSSLVQVTLK